MSDTPEALRFIEAQRQRQGGGDVPLAERPPEYSDMGNGQRFVQLHGNDVRYCAELAHTPCKGWLVWQETGRPKTSAEAAPQAIVRTGGRWIKDETGAVERKAKQTVESIKGEHERYAVGPYDAAKAGEVELAHYQASQQAGKISAMLNMAKSELPIPATLPQFDTNPMLFNCLNGTIDLTTCEFYPARREDLLMKQAPVEFDAEATAPSFITVLHRMFALDPAQWSKTADQEMLAYVARLMGYALTGLAREKALFILYGPPDTGKGTFVETLLALMGDDYAIVTSTDSLMNGKGFAQHPADVAAMEGRRLVIGTETPRTLNVEKLKQLAGGGDTVAARGMRENFRRLKPTWKILLQTNKFPATSDEGFYARLNLLPFESVVPKGQQDSALKETLQTELPGILNFALQGLADYHQTGLRLPKRMEDSATRMRNEVDDLSRFRADCCVEKPGLKVIKSALYEKYLWWCEHIERLPPSSKSRLSQRMFGTLMIESRFQEYRTGAARYWQGIDIVDRTETPYTNGGALSESKLRADSEAAGNSDLFKLDDDAETEN